MDYLGQAASFIRMRDQGLPNGRDLMPRYRHFIRRADDSGGQAAMVDTHGNPVVTLDVAPAEWIRRGPHPIARPAVRVAARERRRREGEPELPAGSSMTWLIRRPTT